MTRNLWLRHINQTIYGGWFTKDWYVFLICTHIKCRGYRRERKIEGTGFDISHQTKTPIANVKLYLELLADKNDEIEEDDILKKLGGQVDKLDFLLQSMVKMSRLETGTIRIQKQLTCISEHCGCYWSCGSTSRQQTDSDPCGL